MGSWHYGAAARALAAAAEATWARLVNVRQAASILSIFSFLLVTFNSPAQAVPGWAQTHLTIDDLRTEKCPFIVRDAIRSVANIEATITPLSSASSMIVGFVPYTGIFVYCIPNSCAPVVAIVTFSDNGSGEAARLRDQISETLPHIAYFNVEDRCSYPPRPL